MFLALVIARSSRAMTRRSLNLSVKEKGDSSKEYAFPIDVFANTLKELWGIEFTPRKEAFFRKMSGGEETQGRNRGNGENN